METLINLFLFFTDSVRRCSTDSNNPILYLHYEKELYVCLQYLRRFISKRTKGIEEKRADFYANFL